MRERPILRIILITVVPAVVAFGVTLAILQVWNSRTNQERVVLLPTAGPTSQIQPRDPQPTRADDSQPDDAPPAEDSTAVPADEDEPAAPTSIPSDCVNPVHEVASGETLGGIAEFYGTSLADLVALNQQVNPDFNADFLSIGQEIVIPECGIPTATPTGIPSPTPTPTRDVPTPIPTVTPLPEGEVVVRIQRVINAGDVTTEGVVLINDGAAVDMEGWTIQADEEAVFTFPSFRLFPEGAVTVFTGAGENQADQLYWGLDQAVWEPGDRVRLYDAEGNLRTTYTIEE